tara:strand:+ start:303 stop:983 length:681 start_codon:yes stop_codon:yes gene_type:complete
MILIHQVYLDFGNHFWCDVFSKSKKSWEKFNGYTYWDIDKINKFLIDYPIYKPLWDKIEKPICKVDYIRICIVRELGGMYVDLDVINTCGHLDWIENDNFFNKVNYGKGDIITNDFFYLNRPNHPIFNNIIEYFNENFDRLKKIDVYKKWIWRFITQSFGPKSFSRYLKKYDLDINYIDVSFIKKNGEFLKNIENSPVLIICQQSWVSKNNGFNPKNKNKYTEWVI